MKRTYAYFQGCSAKSTCRELDVSTTAVAALFGIELCELKNAGCTGAREFRAISEQLHLTANGRILAMAEAQGHELVVVCDTCLLNLTEANRRLQTDEAARESVNRVLATEGLRFEGVTTVKHFLWVLMDDLGEAAIRDKIVSPLTGLRVGPFYGCHMLRPASAYDAPPGDRKPALDRLCEVLGAEVVPYDGADKCCGFHVVSAEEKIALRMSGGHLKNAKSEGAQCLVTPCPLCHTVIDGYQPSMEHELKTRYGLPVLHVAQLVGLAVGLPPKQLGLSRHVVDCRAVIAQLAGNAPSGERVGAR